MYKRSNIITIKIRRNKIKSLYSKYTHPHFLYYYIFLVFYIEPKYKNS